MLSFCDADNTPQRIHDVEEEDVTMKYLKLHLHWKVDKLKVPDRELPQEGDELYIRIPDNGMYLVNH